MLKYRCINNIDGYCYRKPDIKPDAKVYHQVDRKGKPIQDLYELDTCINNWQTCTYFQDWKSQCNKMQLGSLNRFGKGVNKGDTKTHVRRHKGDIYTSKSNKSHRRKL